MRRPKRPIIEVESYAEWETIPHPPPPPTLHHHTDFVIQPQGVRTRNSVYSVHQTLVPPVPPVPPTSSDEVESHPSENIDDFFQVVPEVTRRRMAGVCAC